MPSNGNGLSCWMFAVWLVINFPILMNLASMHFMNREFECPNLSWSLDLNEKNQFHANKSLPPPLFFFARSLASNSSIQQSHFHSKKQFICFNCLKCGAKTICSADVIHNNNNEWQKITIRLYAKCVSYSLGSATKKTEETWNILEREFWFYCQLKAKTKKKQKRKPMAMLVPAFECSRGLSWCKFWFHRCFLFIISD